jgi:hypothetical protein
MFVIRRIPLSKLINTSFRTHDNRREVDGVFRCPFSVVMVIVILFVILFIFLRFCGAILLQIAFI